MIKDYIHIADLLYKQQMGDELSPEELQELNNWEESSAECKHFCHQIRERKFDIKTYETYLETGDARKSWEAIMRRTNYRRYSISKYAFRYAALLLLCLGAGTAWVFLRPSSSHPVLVAEHATPGKAEVILTLSNGQQVALNNDSDFTLTEGNGTTVQTKGKNLQYNTTLTDGAEIHNTLKVPRGGEYYLTLADGTVVWLNSDSELTYPVAFHGDTREIKLKGEAFFDVAHHPEKLFIVHTDQFDIQVTGTRFNIRNYPDEPQTATLAEGHIQLRKDNRVYQVLPGQQAIVEGNRISLQQVKLEEAIAWQYEAFYFKERQLESILNELARWYDIEVFYQNPTIKNLHFTAWFERRSSLAEVIELLEKTEKIKLNLQGKTLVVSKIERQQAT